MHQLFIFIKTQIFDSFKVSMNISERSSHRTFWKFKVCVRAILRQSVRVNFSRNFKRTMITMDMVMPMVISFDVKNT